MITGSEPEPEPLQTSGPEPIEHVPGKGWFYWDERAKPEPNRIGSFATKEEARAALDANIEDRWRLKFES